jgi:hypothetical protein
MDLRLEVFEFHADRQPERQTDMTKLTDATIRPIVIKASKIYEQLRDDTILTCLQARFILSYCTPSNLKCSLLCRFKQGAKFSPTYSRDLSTYKKDI